MGTDADRIAWRSAGSFDDLLGLTADFLEGRRGFFPGWGGGSMDEESDPLLPALRGALRAGLMTVASQPGAPFGPGHDGLTWGGRAFVGGFALEDAGLRRLTADARRAGLLVLVEDSADGAEPAPLVAGLRDGVPYLLLGPGARSQELEIFEEHIAPSLQAALAGRPFLWIVDPAWGRRDRLSGALAGPGRVSFRAANGRSPAP
ncbi:MAG: hypothetical protein VX460_08755 [Planctomycetota bacterium]|nr:hypothetical protein [Planctomycetota bacterium]